MQKGLAMFRKMRIKAFTLIELLVVISIIALLLSILMPSLSRVKEAGKRTVCLNNVKSLALGIIMYTDIRTPIPESGLSGPKEGFLGVMLGAADLLAQAADRIYLEKLLFLYHEFKEARHGGYENEVDLLKKTLGFYDFISRRLQGVNEALNGFMTRHFEVRWGINKDFYSEAIERQKVYLKRILDISDSDPRDFLRRERVVDKVRQTYRGH